MIKARKGSWSRKTSQDVAECVDALVRSALYKVVIIRDEEDEGSEIEMDEDQEYYMDYENNRNTYPI